MIGRRTFLLSASALVLVGCNGAGGGGAVGADEMALGDANAPVTLIEYASTTCSHCAAFHAEVYEELKTNYIDTGRVRYVFREYPTAPAPIAVAGFQLARCGGASSEQYFTRIGELFRQQTAIFATGTMEGVRGKFLEIGGAAGLSEEQIMQCITDEEGADRIRRVVEEGNRQFNITGTPTFIINGEKVTDPSVVTYAGLSRLLDAAGAATN
jgi:protein-disulfide isomerase